MDRGADMARTRTTADRAERWRKAADELKAEILDKGVDQRGRFRQHYGNDELDASLLLIPILGFLPPDDERVRATVLAIADELTEDGLVLRYKVDTTDTGFEGKEGTFTICSFWLVTALAMIGEQERARALCQKLLNFAGPLQLYAEEIDASTGEHLGNFPQAFTHLALIDAVGPPHRSRGRQGGPCTGRCECRRVTRWRGPMTGTAGARGRSPRTVSSSSGAASAASRPRDCWLVPATSTSR